MPTLEVEHQGQVYEIDVAPGQDPAAAVADFEATMGVQPPAPERSLGEEALRGTGLGARAVVGAVPRTVAGLTDLVGMGLNTVSGGIDAADRFISENVFGREPRDPAPPLVEPGGATSFVDDLLNEVFPEPETIPERMVMAGGEALLTGGLGASALARAPGAMKSTPTMARGSFRGQPGEGVGPATDVRGVGRMLGDDIAEFQLREPIKSGAAEFVGGAAAQGGSDVARAADLGPGAQLGAAVVGGIGGAVAPTAGLTGARRVSSAIGNSVPGLNPGVRAARTLQGAVDDPQAAARAAMDAPEGVTPARAAESPKLLAMEGRVLADDPHAAAQVAAGREAAEQSSLDRLSRTFDAETTDPAQWQREVITRAAPEGTTITGAQPDEMVDDAFQAFGQAYGEAHGWPIQTQVVREVGGNVPLPERVGDAIIDPRVLAGDQTRRGIGKWVGALLEDISGRGAPVAGADDTVVQFDSSDLLELRHAVRAEQRRMARAGQTNPDADAASKLLRNVDDAITETLESQLPEAASNALRATDARYSDFRVAADAVARGKGDLTPQTLRAALRGSRTTLQQARGDTGPMGALAEQGMSTDDLFKPSTTEQQVARATRNMTPEQQETFKANALESLMNRRAARGPDVADGGDVVHGDRLIREVERNRDKLKAAGFTDDDFRRIERGARELAMIQKRSPKEVQALLEDNVGSVYRLLAAIAGSRGGAHALRLLGGAAGAGPSLVVAQFGSRVMQQRLTNLSVDQADRLVRRALLDRELFNTLMTKPTDSIKKQADAARTINAWLAQTAPEAEDGEE